MAAAEGDRHYAGGSGASDTAPWTEAKHAAVKDRLYRYVRFEANGVPLRKVISDVFGSDVDSSDAEAKLARHFYDRYPEFFKTYSSGGLTWIQPTLGLYTDLNLRQQYARDKTKGRRRHADQSTTEATDGLEGAGDSDDLGPAYAKDRAAAFLEKYLQIQSDSVKQSLFESFVRDKSGTEDLWQIMKIADREEYHGIPYRTQHNDVGRAMKVKDRFEYALSVATERYNNAVVLTVTTDPKQHSGLSEALENISENKGRLMSWLSTEYQLGYRPENLSVLEFTDSGLPHYHIVLFGVSWAVSQDQLAAKWRDYGQGSVVDVRQAKNRHDGDTWLLHDDIQGRVSLSWYLGKQIRGLVDIAESDAADIRDRLEDGDLSGWKHALYWSSGRRYCSCSQSLKAPTEETTESDSRSWVFVGVSEYNQIPAHVRQNMTFHDRPPPRSSSRTSRAPAT